MLRVVDQRILGSQRIGRRTDRSAAIAAGRMVGGERQLSVGTPVVDRDGVAGGIVGLHENRVPRAPVAVLPRGIVVQSFLVVRLWSCRSCARSKESDRQ